MVTAASRIARKPVLVSMGQAWATSWTGSQSHRACRWSICLRGRRAAYGGSHRQALVMAVNDSSSRVSRTSQSSLPYPGEQVNVPQRRAPHARQQQNGIDLSGQSSRRSSADMPGNRRFGRTVKQANRWPGNHHTVPPVHGSSRDVHGPGYELGVNISYRRRRPRHVWNSTKLTARWWRNGAG